MKKYALIGKSLAHSQSRKIHALIGDYDYNHIQISDSAELESLLADTDYSGFNISSPFRFEIIKYLGWDEQGERHRKQEERQGHRPPVTDLRDDG